MARNNAGASALTLAAIKSDPSIAARLIDYGADPNSPDGKGDFPLHKSVSSGLVGTTRFLLYAGASKEMRNRSGKTPLDLGLRPEIEKVFQEHQAEMIKSSMR
jgi:ankyrin repeat protein